MRMLVACLTGAVIVGLVVDLVLATHIAGLPKLDDPSLRATVLACLAGFLGAIWGWVGRSIFVKKTT